MAKGGILLVEDEKDLAQLFEYALVRRGYRVHRACDAAAGLKALRQWSPDLVLLDVVLPGLSGFEFLEQIRRESRVSVILISGRRSPADRALGLKLGADDYLVKPFSLDELRARVKLALARASRKPRERAAASGPARARRVERGS